MKYYVKQVDPAYQESPLDFIDWGDIMYPDLVLTGNRDYKEQTVPAFDLWRNNWADAADHMAALDAREDARCTDPEFDPDDWNIFYETVREIIEEFFPPATSRGPYSDQEIDRWKVILKDMSTCPTSEEYRPTLVALDLITGGNWKLKTLRGCIQGDWQECYYDSEKYTDDEIRSIEIEYFNLGTKWIVHDEETTPQNPDEISGYSCYVYGSDYRKELSEIIGCNPDELVVYKYTVEVCKAVYELEE